MNLFRDIHRAASASILAALLCSLTTACDKSPSSDETPAPDAAVEEKPAPLEAPRIPMDPKKFSPSLARVVPEEHYDVDTHMETAQCQECHGQIVSEWQDSAHAFASFSNPYYRVSFDEFVQDAGREAAQHCAGCHDPTLLFDGSIHREVEPSDKRAHVGVTCNTCHGIIEATTDGNASYLLSTSTIPMPEEGDAHSLAKHRARLGNAVLRTNALCVSCHEGFLTPDTGHGAVISGLSEFTAYRRSGYNGNPTTRIDSGVERATCVDCHMPRSGPDNLPSHRFAGGHSSLAETIGAPEQLVAIQRLVKGAATLDVGAVGVGEISLSQPPPDALASGDRIWADVVVYNSNTGHTFPGGALDLRDTWLDVVVTDATGKVVATAGQDHKETGKDPTAVQLHAVVASEDGDLVEGHRVHSFRTAVGKHVLNPRDALVARYSYEIGENPPELPLTFTAKLNHRRLHHSMAEAACEESKTERAKAFAARTKLYAGKKVDPCREQPTFVIREATAQLGTEAHTPDTPRWRRHWQRGLGLLHNVQESLPEAIEAFEVALKTLPEDAPDIERARVLFSLGLTAARQGRVEAAMDWWAKAEELVGEHPAIHYARGDVHRRTFRNEEAVKWFKKAAAMVDDDRVWRQLAIAAGSVGQARTAYNAARRGLELEPRDAHLLRSQMLSLQKLEGVDPAWSESAAKAFSEFKRDEQAPHIRDKCSSNDPYCRESREPMRTVEMRAARAGRN